MSALPPSAPPRSLPDLLRQHARRAPHRPWLFWPCGLDWPWASYAVVAAEVARLAGELAAGLAAVGAAPGGAVAYPAAPRPGHLCLDLAIQAAGFAALPLGTGAPGDAAERPGPPGVPVVARVVPREASGGDEDAGPPGAAAAGGPPRLPLTLGGPWAPGSRRGTPPPAGAIPRGAADPAAGGAVVAGRLRSAGELVAAGAALAAALAPAGGPPRRGGQEVVVTARPLAEPGERRLLSWALLAGAAVVLEPLAANLVATAAWARPTVFRGSAAELAALAAAVEADERAGLGGLVRRARRRLAPNATPGLPLGRLHTLLATGPPGPAEGWWRRRGVGVLRLTGDEAGGVPEHPARETDERDL